ncbi:MAG: DUF3276 family protein [Pelolinea sp.]|nr:DUF3276 family protein [Pelolinea sp.]
MSEDGENKTEPIKKKESITTIDDCLVFAGKLYKGLIELSNQKYPLDIRRGVRGMVNERKGGEMIKGSGKTYFLDIEETKSGKPYLKITETRKDVKNGEQIRNSIFVFQEDIRELSQAITRIGFQIGLDEHDK